MPQRDQFEVERSEEPLRLVVADPHEATRAGIRLALGPRRIAVAAEAIDAEGLIREVLRVRPDVCLVSTSLPGGAVRAAREIHAGASGVAIVMFAAAPGDVEVLFASLEAGASGYLLNDIEPTALGDALRGVVRGEAAIPRRLMAAVMSEFGARSAAGGRRHERTALHGLTERQLLVLELLSSGADTAEIGRRMAISRTTVRRHASALVARLGVDSREAAIALYRAVHQRPGGPNRT